MGRHSCLARRLAFAASLLCLSLLPSAARAAWRTAGDVRAVERQTDGVVVTLTSGARVSVTFGDPEAVRVRLAPSGAFERDFSYAVAPDVVRRAGRATVTETDDEIRVTSRGGTVAVIKRRPFLVTVLDDAGRVVVEDDPARPVAFDAETGAVECSKKRVEWETYYGLGEKAGATLSLNSQQFVMWNTDTYGYPRGLDPIYQSIGFYTALRYEKSSAGAGAGRGYAYGLFLDNTTRTYFDMGQDRPLARDLRRGVGRVELLRLHRGQRAHAETCARATTRG